MKNCIVVIVLSSLVFTSCSLIKSMTYGGVTYRVVQIYNGEYDLYIIDVARNDSIFRIISIRGDCNDNFAKIQRGNRYPLNLVQLYPNRYARVSLRQDGDESVLDRNGVQINPKASYFIPLTKRTRVSLYIATNLNGLCLSKDNKSFEEVINRFGIVPILCSACRGDDRFSLILYVLD